MSVDKDLLKIGELKTFVETCREQGIGDNNIVNMAVSLDKWDKNLIEAFVPSRAVPLTSEPPPSRSSQHGYPCCSRIPSSLEIVVSLPRRNSWV